MFSLHCGQLHDLQLSTITKGDACDIHILISRVSAGPSQLLHVLYSPCTFLLMDAWWGEDAAIFPFRHSILSSNFQPLCHGTLVCCERSASMPCGLELSSWKLQKTLPGSTALFPGQLSVPLNCLSLLTIHYYRQPQNSRKPEVTRGENYSGEHRVSVLAEENH